MLPANVAQEVVDSAIAGRRQAWCSAPYSDAGAKGQESSPVGAAVVVQSRLRRVSGRRLQWRIATKKRLWELSLESHGCESAIRALWLAQLARRGKGG